MLSRRKLLSALVLAGLPTSAGFSEARADDVSDWVEAGHARVRLIDAGRDGGQRLAGLQIQLDPNYLTYWRTPGEAGLPPTADFAGSRNLASARLLFPAPQRFDEGGAEAFGYKDEVIFPLSVVPADPAKPVALSLSLSFAVCADLCLPASAAVRLDLTGSGDSPEAGLVRDAVRLVPVRQPLDGPGALAIEAIQRGSSPDRAIVLARAPAGTAAALFCETPSPWFIQVGEGRPAGEGRIAFELSVIEGDKTPARIPATLTLAAAERAIETTVQLDAAVRNP